MSGILLVDDNSNIRRLLRSFIETNTTYAICGEAENAGEGLLMAKELQPDVILLDLTLPGVSGTQAAALIRKALPSVKIILFTMHADGVNQSLAATFGIDRVIAKSESILTLADHLKHLMPPDADPDAKP